MESSRCSSASHSTPLVVVAVVRLSACAPLAAAASGADDGPIPRTSVDGRPTWAGGSDLAGFEVAFEPTGAGAADGGDATGVDTPGCGPAVAVVALVLGIGWLVRRR